jgi:hypothetical protein
VDYDKSEYFITNADKVFAGNSLELMVAMYKCEELPVRVRLYAAGKAVEYELANGKSIEEIRAEIEAERQEDPEESHRKTIELISEFVSYAVKEAWSRSAGRAKHRSGCPAWIGELVDELYAKQAAPETQTTEITPPAPPRPVVRKRESVTIDGTAVQHDCNMDVESGGIPSASDRSADRHSASQPPSEPAASRNPFPDERGLAVEMNDRQKYSTSVAGERNGSGLAIPPQTQHPAATGEVGEPGEDMIEITVPTRSGWLVKHVPRQRGTGFD